MNENIFTPVQTRKTYMEVVEKICESIKRGELKVGDRLPPEVKLAGLLGVSRSSIREALSALKLAGLIDSRSGYGNYICQTADQVTGLDMQQQLVQLIKKDNPFEIIEARECVEPRVARYAAERASQQDIEVLEEIVNRMRSSEGDDKTLLALDSEFHTAIAMASHSDTLIGIVKYLVNRMEDESWRNTKERNLFVPGRRHNTISEHVAIFEAIKNHNTALAQKVVLQHLRNIKSAIITGVLEPHAHRK